MKKLLSIVLSILMVVTATVGFSVSATNNSEKFTVNIFNEKGAIFSNDAVSVNRGDTYTTDISFPDKDDARIMEIGVILDNGRIVEPVQKDDYTLTVNIPNVDSNINISVYIGTKSYLVVGDGEGLIVRNLKNVTSMKSSNVADSIFVGAVYYEETLKPNEGYEIKSVKATYQDAYLAYDSKSDKMEYSYSENDVFDPAWASTFTKNDDGTYQFRCFARGSIYLEVVAEPIATEPTTIEKPISVGKLTNLKATKVTPKYVSVKWNKAENATNYKIEYRKAGKNYKFKTLKTIKGTSATVPKLSANTLYYIKVTPFATKDNKTYYGSNATIKVATATTSINGLKVTNNGKAISIKWNRNKNATGYKVYRLNSKKKYVQVKTIKGNKKTVFKDTKVKSGKIYYYKVKAYRTYNGYGTVLSDYSKQVFSPCGLYATTVTTKSFSGKITVSWSKVSGASGYKVYQSKSKNKGYKCVAKTTKRSYTTKKLTKNKTYYFKVQPYKSYKGKEINPTAKPKVKSQKVISNNSGSSSSHGPATSWHSYGGNTSYTDGNGHMWDNEGNSWTDKDLGGFLD